MASSMFFSSFLEGISVPLTVVVVSSPWLLLSLATSTLSELDFGIASLPSSFSTPILLRFSFELIAMLDEGSSTASSFFPPRTCSVVFVFSMIFLLFSGGC